MTPFLALVVKIAVLNLHATNVPAPLAENLSQVLVAEVAKRPDVQVIGASDIRAMLGFEQQKQMLACDQDSTCLAELGGALGVDDIVVGQLGRVETTYLMSLSLIDLRHARVEARVDAQAQGSATPLIAALREKVPELLSSLTKPLPPGVLKPMAIARRHAWRTTALVSGVAAIIAVTAGGVLRWQGDAAYARYRAAVAPSDLQNARTSTGSLDTASTVAFVVSGVAAALGGTALVLSF